MPTNTTNVVTLLLMGLLLALVLFAMYRRFHPAAVSVRPVHVAYAPPVPPSQGMYVPTQPLPSHPLPATPPSSKPPSCPPCAACKPCPACPSSPSVPPASEPYNPPSYHSFPLTFECADRKTTSAFEVPECFSSADTRVSCRAKVQEFQNDLIPLQTAKSNRSRTEPVLPMSYPPILRPLSEQPPHANSSITNPGGSNFSVLPVNASPPSLSRIAVHYYYLPKCVHCQVFRRDVWEPVVSLMKNEGVTFHEVNGESYDGRMQCQKYGIERFPTVTWSKMGPNQPQQFLRTGNENKDQLISKIQGLAAEK